MIPKLIHLIQTYPNHRPDIIDKLLTNSDTDTERWSKLYRYYKQLDKTSAKTMKANIEYETDDDLWNEIRRQM